MSDAVTRGDEFRFSPRPNRAAEVAWRPWGDAVFREAQEQRKPVLLSISAVWCHWCHVMDEGAYSEPRVIELINQRFVPTRVDNDRRPDVNRRYNMGGWPTTAFLTETGEVLTGATYLPAEDMLAALRRVSEYYAQRRDEVLAQIAAPREPLLQARTHRGADEAEPPSGEDDAPAGDPVAVLPAAGVTAIDWLRREIVGLFDPLFGGLGTEPKFPQAEALAFLLLRAGTRRDARIDEVLTTTLSRMARGDVYDRVGDGFFRYATRRDWSAPHFEKMLEDNARLLRVYLNAHAAYGDEEYLRVADGIIRYLQGTLWLPEQSVFAGSQDADETYYALSAEGRQAHGTPPFIDRTAYVDWNGLAARGLLRAAQRLKQPALAATAYAVLDTLWKAAHGTNGMAHYLTLDGGRVAGGLRVGPVDGLLGDQAHMAAAMLDAYEQSGERAHLARAELLGDWVAEQLTAPDGGLQDRRPGRTDAGLLTYPLPAGEEASLMADTLLRLWAYTGTARYKEQAERALIALSSSYKRQGVMAAPFGAALVRLLEPPLRIVVVGEQGQAATQALHAAALAVGAPLRTVQVLDPVADVERLLRDGYATVGPPKAYVCLGATCLPPTSAPGELTRLARGEASGG
jgi:hypothetical protein